MWTAAWRSPIMRRMRGFLPAAVAGGIPLVGRMMRMVMRMMRIIYEGHPIGGM